jgi:nuclear pore complex protein Nup62
MNNPNFFNQQSKDDDKQKNPFLGGNPFGAQQSSIFSGQQNKPNLFGIQPSSLDAQSPQKMGSTTNVLGASGANPFGAPSNTTPSSIPNPFGAPATTPAGVQAPNPFGASTMPTGASVTAPLGAQPSPFGASAPTAFHPAAPPGSIPASTPYGARHPAPSPFGTSTASPFAPKHETPQFGTTQSPFGAQPSAPPSEGQRQLASPASNAPQEEKAPFIGETKSIQPTSFFGQTSTEKSATFLQMTLGEIILHQTRKLEENIRVFKEKAREIFEQDERIIRAINNYKLIRSKIDDEEKIIAETEDNVEFFENWLMDFQKEIPDGEGDELITCIKMFEDVSARFNRAVEGMKDEEDEIMCLVNENYNLISILDEKLDALESMSRL